MFLALIAILCFVEPLLGLSLDQTITDNCYNRYRKDDELDPVTTVSNGVFAKLKEFPHLTAIGWSNEDRVHWGCGGSLITPNFILTAAHCTYRFQRGKKVPPNVARMGVIELDLEKLNPFELVPDGAEDLAKDKEQFSQQFNIIKVIPHPEYTSKKRYNDVALMQLDKDAKVTDFVMPICLWNKKSVIFTELEAAGFGEVEFASGTSPNLSKVKLTKTNIEDCKKVYDNRGDKKLPDGLKEEQHLCANDKTGREMDTCQGDSGGPLEFKVLTKTGKNWIKLPVLVGLTSFGQAGCGTNDPAVYARVSNYVPWIESETKQNLSLESCSEKYHEHREKIDVPFKEHDSPSSVKVLSDNGECPAAIIHERFVLSSVHCIEKIKTPSFVMTVNGEKIAVANVHENNGFNLIELKQDIKYTQRTIEELKDEAVDMLPYLYRVGPTCLRKDKPDDIDIYSRSIEAKLRDTNFKFEQSIYNLTECSIYLDVKDTVTDEQYECLGGTWFAPKHCHLETSSFSTIDDNSVDEELYHTPIPVLKSFVREHDSCGALLMKKVTDSDIDWITKVVLKSPELKSEVKQQQSPKTPEVQQAQAPPQQMNSYTQSFGQSFGGAANSASNFFFG